MIPVDFTKKGKKQYSVIKTDNLSQKEVGQYDTRTQAFEKFDEIKAEMYKNVHFVLVCETLLWMHFKDIAIDYDVTYQIIENYD